MRLSKLIRERKEAILQDFEDFARTHTAAGASMEVRHLRDHAESMLDVFARVLDAPESDRERGPGESSYSRRDDGDATAAEEHGTERARSGFSLDETFAEYRALRASVMRHWTEAGTGSVRSEIEDVIRFNEEIDRAIAESIHEFSKAVNGYRETFLAVLGHDLRSPLNAVLNASEFLTSTSDLSDRDQRLAEAINGSGTRMRDLIDDMLEYTSSELGAGMRLRRSEADLGGLVDEVVRQSEITHPGREFRTDCRGDLGGMWDLRRIRQALLNLVDNAVQHGAEDSTVTVSALGDAVDQPVVLAVHNRGTPIPEGERERIFQPFERGSSSGADAQAGQGRRGLGLYIARRMAEAHGGGLEVRSSHQDGTTFSIRLPRQPPDEPTA